MTRYVTQMMVKPTGGMTAILLGLLLLLPIGSAANAHISPSISEFFDTGSDAVTDVMQGSIEGRVTDAETRQPLPGATVQRVGEAGGTVTDMEGRFQFSNVESGDYLLRISFVGYETQDVSVTVTTGVAQVNVALVPSALELDDVVVTGVSVGTPTTKLPFSIGRVTAGQLEEVPGIDPGNALRAKVPGLRVVQGSGLPGAQPGLKIRGSSTLQPSQSPLIIVDGIVTSGSLQDIDMQSVETIEVIKGAAAASLYGSLAGSGVIQIITKRGAAVDGTTEITVRNEFGFTQLGRKVPLANSHDYEIIDGVYRDEDGHAHSRRGMVLDQPFSTNYDHQDDLFTSRPFMTNYISVASRQGNLNYLVSFENYENQGIIVELPSHARRNVRLNVDNRITDKLTLSATGLYSNTSGYTVTQTGQGANMFFGVLAADPDVELTAPGPEGHKYNPYVSIGNAQNPLYVANTRNFERNRERVLGRLNMDLMATDWWSLGASYSIDRRINNNQNLMERGTLPSSPTGIPSIGSISRTADFNRVTFFNARSLFTKDFGDLAANLSLSYIYEDRRYEATTASGSGFRVEGVPTLDNTEQERLSASSTINEVKAETISGNLQLDYRDRYIIDAVVRQDGSSLFGEDERYKIYYRLGGAYRLSQDFPMRNIDELKLRASYGTSGQRPPFAAQYETLSVTDTGILKLTAGNKDIKPADVRELELGLDARFFDRYFFEFNYASTVAEDQILSVPLSPTTGYRSQWQNVGRLESAMLEAAFNGALVQTDNFTWDFHLTFDRLLKQKVARLDIAPFTRAVGSTEGLLSDLFLVEEGVEYGTMIGNKFATSFDDLTLDDDGYVMNIPGYTPGAGDDVNLRVQDLKINSDGYVVIAAHEYTEDERALLMVDETGERLTTHIGNVNPDFNVGIGSTFRYGGFTLYTLLDWAQGGDVYNFTRQKLYDLHRHADMDMAGVPEGQKRATGYFATGLYNGSTPVSHFVEDGSFLKLREVSVSYNVTEAQMAKLGIGNVLRDARVSVVGRNLLTFTGYSGADPEVGLGTNITFNRVDEFAYPNFRTYSVSLQLRF